MVSEDNIVVMMMESELEYQLNGDEASFVDGFGSDKSVDYVHPKCSC